MTRRRWIADKVEGDRAFLLGPNAHHLARVLRARPGQEFDVVCDGRVRLGTIAAISDDEVVFTLGAEVPQPQLRPISLVLAVFKFDRMEWAIEKATELGVASIQPVIARRTDAHLVAAAAKRVERWRRIAHEAAQQSRRLATPEVPEPLKLKDALQPLDPATLKIVLAETEQNLSLAAALGQQEARPVALAIGPEGGWTGEELQQFAAAGWTSASLGPTILRAETAAIAALAVTALTTPSK